MGSVAESVGNTFIAPFRAVYDFGKNATTTPSNPLVGALKDQQAQSEALQKKMLAQPKQIQADNFLSNKLRSQSSLRMGLASTMTGAGLSTPSLTGQSAGKQKMGT